MALIGNNAVEIEAIETDNIGSLGSLMLAELPQCNDLIIRQQLGAALREFCRETNACTVELPVMAVLDETTGEAVLPIPPPPRDMVIGTVLGVTIDGRATGFEIEDWPAPRIKVDGYLSAGEMAKIRFSVYPKVGSETCPGWFKERYAEAIMAGAMYQLLSMTKRPWADPARATQYGAKYADAIAEAAYRSNGSAMRGGGVSAIPSGGIFM